MRWTGKLRKNTPASKGCGKTLVDASPKKPAREARGSKGFAVTRGQWEVLNGGCHGRVNLQHGKLEVFEPRKQIELLQAFPFCMATASRVLRCVSGPAAPPSTASTLWLCCVAFLLVHGGHLAWKGRKARGVPGQRAAPIPVLLSDSL